MPSYFVDSSALVKRYRREAGSEVVARLLDAADRIAVSGLTPLEVSAALVRRGRGTGRSEQNLAAVLLTLDDDVRKSLNVIHLSAPLIEQATLLIRLYGLRAADAIQLACARSIRDESRAPNLIFLGSDRELNAAALREAFAVVDPTSDEIT